MLFFGIYYKRSKLPSLGSEIDLVFSQKNPNCYVTNNFSSISEMVHLLVRAFPLPNQPLTFWAIHQNKTGVQICTTFSNERFYIRHIFNLIRAVNFHIRQDFSHATDKINAATVDPYYV